MADVRSYSIVTASYWGFTVTDGALRMLVLLHFHNLGFTPVSLAFLFLLYEFMGIVTNLFGGWIGARYGLRLTLYSGLGLQVVALAMLANLPAGLTVTLSVIYVMLSQALSGIAKDLTKMSSKSAIKFVVEEGDHKTLYKWVSLLTGSKNALKGAGFFIGAFLLQLMGYKQALLLMATVLFAVLLVCFFALGDQFGKIERKVKFREIFSKTRQINLLSAARVFLFCSRDVWFVVGLPVFLVSQLNWNFEQTGAFMAFWVIGYGAVQAAVPGMIKNRSGTMAAAQSAKSWGLILALSPVAIAGGISGIIPFFTPAIWIVGGLIIFGFIFAINSALHSYLIVGYAERENASLSIGFYYMANAVGRFIGTLLSGFIYQLYGLAACLLISACLIVISVMIIAPLGSKGKTNE